MNDPHVVELHYRVEHGSSYDYDRVPPIVVRTEAFDIRVEEKQASFRMTKHYATEKEARATVQEYVRGWELEASLRGGPNSFKLRFDRADIKDRNPTQDGNATPGMVFGRGSPIRCTGRLGEASGVVSLASYPSPPSRRLKVSPDVQSMLDRFAGFRQGREPLSSMAYFCLTVLERNPGGRAEAAKKFGISRNVLEKVGKLTSKKGGTEARKACGLHSDLQSGERGFWKRR